MSVRLETRSGPASGCAKNRTGKCGGKFCPILCQPEHHALPARECISLDTWKTAQGVGSPVAEVVIHLQAEFGGNLMCDIHVQPVAQTGQVGLQMIVQSLAGHVGQRNVAQKALRYLFRRCIAVRVGRKNRAALRATWDQGARIGLRCRVVCVAVKQDILRAEIAASFRLRRDRGKRIHRVPRPRAAKVDVEKCFVAAIVDVRNFQRPAEVDPGALRPPRKSWAGSARSASTVWRSRPSRQRCRRS